MTPRLTVDLAPTMKSENSKKIASNAEIRYLSTWTDILSRTVS